MSVPKAIKDAQKALISNNTKELIHQLGYVARHLHEFPEDVKLDSDSSLHSLVQTSIKSSSIALRRRAWMVISNTLLRVKTNSDEISPMLALIVSDIWNVPYNVDMHGETFDTLASLCSHGKRHAEAVLQQVSLKELSEFNYLNYSSDTLESYIRFVGTVLRQGERLSGSLRTAARIFETTLLSTGNTCAITANICDTTVSVLDELQKGDLVDVMLEVNFADSLVRHVTTREKCNRECLESVMKLMLEFLDLRHSNYRRFLTRNVFNVLGVCLNENHSEVQRLGCVALAKVLKYAPPQMDDAVTNKLFTTTVQLHGHPDEMVRTEARRVMSYFFKRCTYAQLIPRANCKDKLNGSYICGLTTLLRFEHSDTKLGALRAICAFVNAQRIVSAVELPSMHRLLNDFNVRYLCHRLKNDEDPEVRLNANALHNFMSQDLSNLRMSKPCKQQVFIRRPSVSNRRNSRHP